MVNFTIEKLSLETINEIRDQYYSTLKGNEKIDLVKDFHDDEITTLINDWKSLSEFIFAYNDDE